MKFSQLKIGDRYHILSNSKIVSPTIWIKLSEATAKQDINGGKVQRIPANQAVRKIFNYL